MRNAHWLAIVGALGGLAGCGSGGGGTDDVGVELSVVLGRDSEISGTYSLAGGGDGTTSILGDTVVGTPPMTAEVGARAYVGFRFGRIPVGSVVESAILEIHLTDTPVGDPSTLGPIYAVPVDFDFVMSYPFPVDPATPVFSTPSGSPATVLEADVTDLVADDVAGLSEWTQIGVRYGTDSNDNGLDDYTAYGFAHRRLRIRTP